MTIARTWLGRTPAESASAYLTYLEQTGVKDCLRTPGNEGVMVLRRIVDDEARFWFVSFWDSIESIRGFAGEDAELARYYDGDRQHLLDLPARVEHFDVVFRGARDGSRGGAHP